MLLKGVGKTMARKTTVEMNIVVKGKNLEITDALRAYVLKKIGRLGRYLDNITEAVVELSDEKIKNAERRHVAQITLTADGTILRAEERATDLHSALDAVVDVIQRQIVRYKERLYQRHRVPADWKAEGATEAQAVADEQPKVVRTKRFPVKPMSVEEAVEQMELLGHDFFVFIEAMSGNINVLYRRKDGNYGLLEPEIL